MKKAIARVALACLLTAPLCGVATADIVGFRTDGTGEYDTANPPTAWSTTQNVIWSADLPKWSNATPVIVGDRIFICAEPTTLICLNKADGSILWQAKSDMLDTVPEADREDMLAKVAQFKADQQQARQMGRKLNQEKKKLRANPDDEALKAEIVALEAKLATINEGLAATPEAGNFILPRAHGTNGYATPTPVSDGKHVWTLHGNGVASCFTLDGERKWTKLIERPTAGWGQSSSLVLTPDGTVTVLVNKLYGLDAATGETKWTARSKQSWGSPIAATLDGKPLIITPNGEVIAPSTGDVLASGLGKVLYAAPVMDGDVVYFIQNRSSAARLSWDDQGKLKAENLWDAKITGSRHYASPIVADGLIYALSREEHFTVMDAKDGSVIYDMSLRGEGKKNTNSAYPSVVRAGDLIYLSNEQGKTVVIKTGNEHEVVATNQLEGFRGCLVFEDDRVYIRGHKKMWCLGG